MREYPIGLSLRIAILNRVLTLYSTFKVVLMHSKSVFPNMPTVH